MKGCHLNGKKDWAKLEWIDKEFYKRCKEIIKKRIEIGKEDPLNPNGIRRVTKALIRLSNWNDIENRLINSDWKEDRWKNE